MSIVCACRWRNGQGCKTGFTLIEVLVATSILLIVILVLFTVLSGMTKLWSTTSGTVSDFQSARLAFTTLNRVLSRATLHTYYDYVDANNSPFGNFRTTSSGSFTPVAFARASELQFLAGPTPQLLGQSGNATLYPGDAIFFQAPLGFSNNSAYQPLTKSVNNVGFYVQYGTPLNLPAWLNTLFGATNRFRLVEAIQATESNDIYTYTSTGSYNALKWLPLTLGSTTSTESSSSYISSVLAENVLLLIIRPRLEQQDEQTAAPKFGMTYGTATANSIISPDYNYDSRAWESGYPSGSRVMSASNSQPAQHALFMRNQLPPIVDLAMICADSASLARFANSAIPPGAVQVPATLFTNSANLDQDLATYGQQLSAQHIHFRLFRSSVQMQGASWINN